MVTLQVKGDSMITFIEKGQVFGNLKYFLVIKEVDENLISYDFYNKHEFYFEPTKKKHQNFDADKVSTIEVATLLSDFLKKLDKGSFHPLHEYYNKKPILGVKVR